MRERLLWGIFKVFYFCLQTAPGRLKVPFLMFLANLTYHLDRKHRRIIRINLNLAFGNTLDSQKKEMIARTCYRNLMFLIADFLENQNISRKDLLKKVTFHNERVVREAIRQKRNIIFISAHFGNWEVMLPAIAASLCPFTAVSKSLKDKKIDDFVTRSRERFGVNIVEKRGAVRHLVKAMRKGKHIAIMVDQNVGGDGIEVSFFGKKASHTPVASHLARRFNALIIPAFSFPDPSFSHFDIYFYEPIQVNRSRDIEEDISRATQAQASITERVIRQNPEHWFWLHRRWKEYYRPVYNENSKLVDKRT